MSFFEALEHCDTNFCQKSITEIKGRNTRDNITQLLLFTGNEFSAGEG